MLSRASIPLTDHLTTNAGLCRGVAPPPQSKGSILTTLFTLLICSSAMGQATLQFAANNYGIAEHAGAATVFVTCQGTFTGEVRVPYATVDGTGACGLDYVACSGVMTFAPGQTNLSIAVPIVNNGFAKGTRHFDVTLGRPSGDAVLGPLTTATVSIIDNDFGVQFGLAASSVPENGGAVIIAVVRGDDSTDPVSVDFATSDATAKAGVHYTGVTNTLLFTPNEAFRIVSIPITNNHLRDGNRSFLLSLSNPIGITLGTQVTVSVTVTDDDGKGIRLESSTQGVSEDAGVALVKVVRAADVANSPATVDYTTTAVTAEAGLDFTATSGTLSFAAGEHERLVPIPILNDGVKESTESFRLSLSNPSVGDDLGSPNSAAISIYDNDAGVGFSSQRYTNSWGNKEDIQLTVVRGTDQFLGPFKVNYATADVTARAGTDYEASSGTVEFGENETLKSLHIRILRSVAVEGTKSFRVTLSNPTGGLVLARPSTSVDIVGAYCTVAPPFDSELILRGSPEARTLTWTGGGQLERADLVAGPWQALLTARTPWTIQASAPTAFYRVRNPRPVEVYVPSSYDENKAMPLVIALHGYTGSGNGMEAYMQFRPLAEARGFLYCHPDGTFDHTGNRFWSFAFENASDASSIGYDYADDAGYLQGLIKDIAKRFNVDRKRVYLVGHSNGAYMSHRMASRHADLLAGIATLAGVMVAIPEKTKPSEPVNVLHIHGTADTEVPYTDFVLRNPNVPLLAGAMHTIQQWAGYNGAMVCVTDSARTLDLDQSLSGVDTTVTRYIECPPGGAVELWTINGGTHIPVLSSGFSTRVIDWLLAHPKP